MKSPRNIVGQSNGSKLDYMTEIVGDGNSARTVSAPRNRIGAFVGACLGGGIKSERITSYLKGAGYTNRQIMNGFEQNM
jgi:hypothetical protein